MQNHDDQPRRRRLRFFPGLEPGPTFIKSELSFEENCERYLAASRARAEESEQKAAKGSGDQGGKGTAPAKPDDDEPNQARRRRKPGVR